MLRLRSAALSMTGRYQPRCARNDKRSSSYSHRYPYLYAEGRAVLTAPLRQNRLDVSDLPVGVYTLQLQLAGETIRKRLVRQAE